jgi:hypothetical protein
MLGVSAGHSDCVVMLLKYGANTNLVDEDQHPALFRAVSGSQCGNVMQVRDLKTSVLVTLWLVAGGTRAPGECRAAGEQGGEPNISRP